MEGDHPGLIKAMDQVFDFCVDYTKSPGRGRTLIIHGDNGTGKSRLSRKISRWAKQVAMKLPLVVDQLGMQGNMMVPSVHFSSWPEVVDGFKRDEWQILEDMQAATLLLVDDIGAEHDPSRIGVEKMYVLLNRREFRWNVFSTNVAPAGWVEKFERRIASRFYRNAIHVDLSGVPDFSQA
jgi:DNA replication protein DnaC